MLGTCIDLVTSLTVPREVMYQNIVDLFAGSVTLSSDFSVLLVIDGDEYRSAGYTRYSDSLIENIVEWDTVIGMLELSYTDPDGHDEGGQLLADERVSLKNIAKVITKSREWTRDRQEISERETLYRNLVKSQSNLIFQTDAQGRITYYNKRSEEYFSWNYENGVHGQRPIKMVQPYHHRRIISSIKQCFENPGKIFQVEIDHLGKNGTPVTILWEVVGLSDESGNVTGVQYQGFDITDRKTMEKASHMYKASIDQANFGVVLLSEDNENMYVNDTVCEYFQWPREYFLGNSMADIHPAWVMKRVAELSDLLAKHGEFISEAIDFEKNDGTVFTTLANGNTVTDSSGNFLCKAITLIDVTDKKEHEERIRKSESRYRKIVDTMHEGIWILDTDDRTLFTNARMASMLGSSEEEMRGAHFFSYVKEEEYVRARKLLSASSIQDSVDVEHEDQAVEGEFTLVPPGRDEIFVALRSVPHFTETGKFAGTQKMVMDITKAKMAESERVARQAAEEANRSKSVFLSNMSHEIRTPLNAVIGFSQILQRDTGLSAKQIDQIKTIARSGEHLLELINDILDLSKIEAGRVTVNLSDFDLHGFLDDVKSLFYLPATKKGLSLTFEGKASIPKLVRADEGKLRQIMINLVGNAMKFTTEGGIVARFATLIKDDKQFLEVEVEDSGLGIPEKDIGTIFDSFRQSDAGKHIGGTGLGLAICSQMLELMGGSISVQSVEGKGSSFRFTFPFTETDSVDEKESSRLDREVIGLEETSGNISILIVDDRKENRDLLEEILKPIGFRTTFAENGKEAVDLFFSWKPDCILMDLRMPVLDGYEATTLIRKDRMGKTLPIIAVTASAFEDDEKEVLRAGFDGYIRKPFRRGELFAVLQKLLGLTYLFASGGELKSAPEERALTSDDLSSLEETMKKKMVDAVEEGDMMEFSELVREVEKISPRVAQALQEMAGMFDYEGILSLLA